MRERRRSAANGSLDFNYDFKQANGQRNPVGRNSFSDESDGGSLMMGSVDLSAQNYDFIGASGSSDESASQSTVCSGGRKTTATGARAPNCLKTFLP